MFFDYEGRFQIILGEEGGQENCRIFPLFVTFFNLIGPLRPAQIMGVNLGEFLKFSIFLPNKL